MESSAAPTSGSSLDHARKGSGTEFLLFGKEFFMIESSAAPTSGSPLDRARKGFGAEFLCHFLFSVSMAFATFIRHFSIAS